MARTSRKAKAVTVATVAEAATDAEIRTVGDVLANVTAVRPVPETAAASGETVFISLDKLKKSPRNARKTPHTEGGNRSLCGQHRRQGHAPEPRRGTGA